MSLAEKSLTSASLDAIARLKLLNNLSMEKTQVSRNAAQQFADKYGWELAYPGTTRCSLYLERNVE